MMICVYYDQPNKHKSLVLLLIKSLGFIISVTYLFYVQKLGVVLSALVVKIVSTSHLSIHLHPVRE
jgi:hypothetical protein